MIFSRYNRLGQNTQAGLPPPFNLPSQIPEDSPDFGSNEQSTPNEAAFFGGDNVGTSPNDSPENPSMLQDAWKRAGTALKATPPPPPANMAGAPVPGMASDQAAAMAPQLNTGGDEPPIPPAGMQGAPQMPGDMAQSALKRYGELQAPQRPNPNIWQKLGAAALGGIAGLSNSKPGNRPIDPSAAIANITGMKKYGEQMADFGQKKADLANQIKLSDSVENTQSLAESRRAQGEARSDAASARVDASLAKRGLVMLPPGVAPDPNSGLVAQPNPYSGNKSSPYAGYSTYYDPHMGKFKVTPEQAELSNGALKAGDWTPLNLYPELVKAGIAAGKPVKETTIPVSVATARQLHIMTGPNSNGTVDVPISSLNILNTAENKPDKPDPQNADHWIAVVNDPNASPAEKAIAEANIKRKEKMAGETRVIVNAANPGNQINEDYIDAVSKYEADPPSPRSTNYQAVIGAVKKINPKWDVRSAAAGKRALGNFTSGKTADAVDAINTVAGHLKTLDDAATALKNHDVRVLNRLGNYLGVQFGNTTGDAVAMYNTIVHRIGPELGKAYGTATEGENNVNQSDFDASRGSNLIHGAIGVSANLLNGKIKALKNRYEKAIPGREFDLVSPEAQQVFDHLGGNGQSHQIVVVAPDGSKHPFNSQGEADAFKRLAGIK